MADENAELPRELAGKLRQFNRVLMSYVDFQQAGGIAGYIISENLHDRYPRDRFLLQGLNCAMIVAYCRPFSGNDRGADVKIPDLPPKILQALTPEEREIHAVIMEDRNTVLAHSDSRAWEPRPQIHRVRGRDILVPMFNYAHAPLTRAVTEQFATMCHKLREACFEERLRLEPELKPYLPVVEVDEQELKRFAEERGIKWPT
ncbi:MAG: hypothetical protein HY581_05260 [Nitrospirae bacterium]|nr:hypothetical protein [Nitrospirota bacterium]